MKENYMLGLSNPASEYGLALQWSFNLAAGTPCTYSGISRTCEVDLSGSGNDGLLGALPTVENQLQYSTGLKSTEPVSPEALLSTAPLIGGGDVIAMLTPRGNVTIELKSYDSDGDDLTTIVVGTPKLGTLSLVDSGAAVGMGGVVMDPSRTTSKRIVYTSFTVGGLSAACDNFTYSVFDGTDYAHGR